MNSDIPLIIDDDYYAFTNDIEGSGAGYNGNPYMIDQNSHGLPDEMTDRNTDLLSLGVPRGWESDPYGAFNVPDMQPSSPAALTRAEEELVPGAKAKSPERDVANQSDFLDLEETQTPFFQGTLIDQGCAAPEPSRTCFGSLSLSQQLGEAVDGPSNGGIMTRAKRGLREDWTKHRPLITRLYSNMTLREVMRQIEKEHGFIATERTYKRYVKAWGLDKHKKENEMQAIVRKRAQRSALGKNSAFKVRDKELQYSEIVRYFSRKGLSMEDVIARARTSPTPDAVTCFTPVRSPIATPEHLKIPEYLFSQILDYVNGSFQSGLWFSTEPDVPCRSTKDCWDDSLETYQNFMDRCREACNFLRINAVREAEVALHFAVRSFRELLLVERPDSLFILFDRLLEMVERQRPDAAAKLIQMIAGEMSCDLGGSHPIQKIIECLCGIDRLSFVEINCRCFRALAKSFTNNLDPLHINVLLARQVTYIATVDDLRQALQECKDKIGSYNSRTMIMHFILAEKLVDERRFDLARQECLDLLNVAQMNKSPAGPAHFRSYGLYLLAYCQKGLGDLSSAVRCLKEAINTSLPGENIVGGITWEWVELLQTWLIKLGGQDEAEEVRRTYHAIWYTLSGWQ